MEELKRGLAQTTDMRHSVELESNSSVHNVLSNAEAIVHGNQEYCPDQTRYSRSTKYVINEPW